MSAYERLAAAVLVAHQRRDDSSCLCGWGELGASHAEHVASVLASAGALNVPPAFRGGWSIMGQARAERERDAERDRANACKDRALLAEMDRDRFKAQRNEAQDAHHRLAEALETIADAPHHCDYVTPLVDIARAALEGTP